VKLIIDQIKIELYFFNIVISNNNHPVITDTMEQKFNYILTIEDKSDMNKLNNIALTILKMYELQNDILSRNKYLMLLWKIFDDSHELIKKHLNNDEEKQKTERMIKELIKHIVEHQNSVDLYNYLTPEQKIKLNEYERKLFLLYDHP